HMSGHPSCDSGQLLWREEPYRKDGYGDATSCAGGGIINSEVAQEDVRLHWHVALRQVNRASPTDRPHGSNRDWSPRNSGDPERIGVDERNSSLSDLPVWRSRRLGDQA